MANARQGYKEATPFSNPSHASNSGAGGVCIMSSRWRDEQHSSFISFISCFLNANAFRLNCVPIAPDFIFNCGGLSVAFIFEANWDCTNVASIFDRVQKLKEQFAHFYVVVTVPTKEQNDSFVRSYFRYGMEIGKPTFIPVQDLELGFEKIVKISHAHRVCKRQDAVSQLKAERERSVQHMDIFLKVVSSIPGVDKHDANAMMGYRVSNFNCGNTVLDIEVKLSQAFGSIEAIANASKDYILANTDLSAEKAEKITSFFRDPKFYLSPKII